MKQHNLGKAHFQEKKIGEGAVFICRGDRVRNFIAESKKKYGALD